MINHYWQLSSKEHTETLSNDGPHRIERRILYSVKEKPIFASKIVAEFLFQKPQFVQLGLLLCV
jgi:hypothetical protein